MITKVSSREASAKKPSVCFSKQSQQFQKEKTQNNLEKSPSSDQLTLSSSASSKKPSNAPLLLSALATVLGGTALVYGLRKGKTSTVENAAETIVTGATSGTVKKSDFTDLLLRGSFDDPEKATAHLAKLADLKMKLKVKGADGRDAEQVIKIKDHLESLAGNRIYQPNVTPLTPRNGSKPVVWMVTAEDLKITKNGGLAEVPPQLATAISKNGLATPVIVSPLYKINGTTYVRRFSNGKEVRYNSAGFAIKGKTGELTPEAGNIKKLMDFKMPVVSEGKKHMVNMEVFHAVEKVKNKAGEEQDIHRILLGSDGYFEQCYNYDMPIGEQERFGAILSKGAYELRKIVEEGLDTRAVADITIPQTASKEGVDEFHNILKSIQPDATVLNDWHTSSVPSLYTIMAPIEAAQGSLKPETAKRLMDENTSTIVHNAIYQGNTSGQTSANIINTLFGDAAKFVVDTTKIAYRNAPAQGVTQGSEHVFKLNGEDGSSYSSLLHIGAALSKSLIPVSKHYATEIATDIADTANIRHILAERFNAHSMTGITNGNEKFDGSASMALIPEKAAKINADLGISYEPYDYSPTASLEENLRKKTENKKAFIPWLKGKFSAKEKPVILFSQGKTDISDVTEQNIGDIPIILMGARVANQKGFDVAKKAILDIHSDYETRYPGKQLPLILIGGPDSGDGAIVHLQKLKEELGEKGKRVVAINGWTPNPAFFPVADITLEPSYSEPCGLTVQPALNNMGIFVASKLGGHVDTVQEGKTGILKPLAEFSDGVRESLDLFHNSRDTFQQMQNNGLKADFSWITEEADGKLSGPAIEHLQQIGVQNPKFKG